MHHAARLLCGLLLGLACAHGATAQTVSEAVKGMLGSWEMSNAERDKACYVNFKLDPAPPGRTIEQDKACTATLPILKNVVAWVIGKDDALQLVDAKGKVIVEFTEVENGLFESAHTADMLYFLQTAAAAEGRGRTPDDMFGNWAIARGASGRLICQFTLENTAADTDSFAITVRPGCDSLVTNFSPRAWRMDRGQFVLLSSKGDPWRFEESDVASTWKRIPEGRNPLLMMKQ
jgi:hypothetical protein